MNGFRFNEKYLSQIPALQVLVSLAHREIDLLKKLAGKYKEQKRGLMQKLLTGDWRVDGIDAAPMEEYTP